jgi:hypothetical protein
MANHIDQPATAKLLPWQNLLANAEKNASIISAEVIKDAVLGRSITAAISSYFAQADSASFLREEFARADTACRDARTKAAEVMRAFGLAQHWQQDDLKAADEELWASLARLTANAAEFNQKRTKAASQERELFENAIDVIDTCTGIATLRHLQEFRCEGDAFCAAYVTSLSIADNMIGKSLKLKGLKILSNFVQYSLGLKPAYRDCDIYFHSKSIFGLGRTMGIDDTNAMHTALLLAIKKNAKMPSRVRPLSKQADGKGIGNLPEVGRQL